MSRQRLAAMHSWLDQHAPGEQHYVDGERGPPQAALMYFDDIETVAAFCEEFGRGRLDGGKSGAARCGRMVTSDD